MAPLRLGRANLHPLHQPHPTVRAGLVVLREASTAQRTSRTLPQTHNHQTPTLNVTKHSYADVVVHRLLAAAIGVAPLPEALMSKGKLHDLADNMNRRHKAAQVRRWRGYGVAVCI